MNCGSENEDIIDVETKFNFHESSNLPFAYTNDRISRQPSERPTLMVKGLKCFDG